MSGLVWWAGAWQEESVYKNWTVSGLWVWWWICDRGRLWRAAGRGWRNHLAWDTVSLRTWAADRYVPMTNQCSQGGQESLVFWTHSALCCRTIWPGSSGSVRRWGHCGLTWACGLAALSCGLFGGWEQDRGRAWPTSMVMGGWPRLWVCPEAILWESKILYEQVEIEAN